MIDQKFIGHEFPDFVYQVEPFQLRLFAKAIGETTPLYLDSDIAGSEGYASIPAPPSFPFSVSMNPADPLDLIAPMELQVARILHGSQSFTYHRPICAGDRIRVTRRISNISVKKGGALEFITYEIRYLNADRAELVCEAEQVLVYRNPEPAP